LAQALKAERVQTLVIFGGNLFYNRSPPIWIGQYAAQSPKWLYAWYYEDETFPYCDWHLPAAHFLESWGDAQTSDGTLVPVQPLIAPLFWRFDRTSPEQWHRDPSDCTSNVRARTSSSVKTAKEGSD